MDDHSSTHSALNNRSRLPQQKASVKPTLSKTAQLVRLAELSIQVQIEHSQLGKLWKPGFEEIARLLNALPLTTAEFAFAYQHLWNARDYSLNREFGAAAFELRMVRGCLQNL